MKRKTFSLKTSDNNAETLQALYECIEKECEAVNTYASKGLPVSTERGSKLRCYFVIVSYDANIPKARDRISVKHGVFTSFHVFDAYV